MLEPEPPGSPRRTRPPSRGELLDFPLQLADPGILGRQLFVQELLPHQELVGFSLEKVKGLDLRRQGVLSLSQLLPPNSVQFFKFSLLHFGGTSHLLETNILDLVGGEVG